MQVTGRAAVIVYRKRAVAKQMKWIRLAWKVNIEILRWHFVLFKKAKNLL